MFCKYCGSQLSEDSRFCACCGNTVEDVNATVPAPVQPQVINEEPEADQNTTLVYGILSLALSAGGGLSVLGIIFGIMAAKQAEAYRSATGRLSSRVKLGKNLGKAGLITGIAMTAFWVVYFTVFIALFATSAIISSM